MNVSPVMMKALFSAIGIKPEDIISKVDDAVSAIAMFQNAASRIEQRLIRIENHLGIDSDSNIELEILVLDHKPNGVMQHDGQNN